VASTIRWIYLVDTILNLKIMERKKWFDRKFDFNQLSTTFEGVLERLDGTPPRLEAKLKDVNENLFGIQMEGTWSIKENVGHLGDLEPLWLGRIYDFLEGEEVLREADLSNQKTHQAGHNEQPMQSLFSKFRSDRRKLIECLKPLEDKGYHLVAKHPRLGTPMRVIDLMYFVAEHDDNHLARITWLIDNSD